MATYTITRDANGITINDFTDVQPGAYKLDADALNDVLIITSESGEYRAEIHTLLDTVTVNGAAAFVGTAAELKTLLYSEVFADLAGGGAASYLVYTALLTQTGTDAPTATVLENTLGGPVVWSYVDVGTYKATYNTIFTIGKVICLSTGAAPDGIISCQLDTGTLNIYTSYSVDGTLSNNYLSKTSVEIRVYP